MPQNWKSYKLSELIDLIGGGTPKTQVPEYWNGSIPWLSVVDFGNSTKHVFKTEKKITEKGLLESSTKLLKKGHLIISARGTVGELAVLVDDMAFNQSCYGINSKEKTINDYIYYLIKHNVSQIRRKTHGAVFDTITRLTFENIEVQIPTDLDEQSRIASILSSLDDKIELNLQINKTLEAIAQAIFKEWFVDFRFPGFDGELVDGLPKGWYKKNLNQIAQVEIGRTPPRMENQWFSSNNKDIKWISIRDLGNAGIYIFNTAEYLTSEAVKKFRIPVIQSNTVVLSFKLTIGRVAITTENMLSNEAIAQIKSNEYEAVFIYCLLRNYNFDSLGSTSSIATAINSKIIKEMEVLVPELKVVKDFCRITGPIFNKIKNNSLEIKTLSQIRDALLPKLMTGKIKVA